MKIVILDGYAANPGDLDYHLLEKLGEVVVYPRTSDAEKVERAKDADMTPSEQGADRCRDAGAAS